MLVSNALRVDLLRSCNGLKRLELATVTARKHARWARPSARVTLAGDHILKVDPGSDGASRTWRSTPPRLRFGAAAWCEVFVTAGVVKGAVQAVKSCPDSRARLLGGGCGSSPRWVRSEDLLRHRTHQDGRDASSCLRAAPACPIEEHSMVGRDSHRASERHALSLTPDAPTHVQALCSGSTRLPCRVQGTPFPRRFAHRPVAVPRESGCPWPRCAR
jgi:hypothetical protein